MTVDDIQLGKPTYPVLNQNTGRVIGWALGNDETEWPKVSKGEATRAMEPGDRLTNEFGRKYRVSDVVPSTDGFTILAGADSRPSDELWTCDLGEKTDSTVLREELREAGLR